MGFLKVLISTCLFCCFFLLSSAQINLLAGKPAAVLVKEVLLGSNQQIEIRNVKYTGSRSSIAHFYNSSPRAIFSKGIILTTGAVPNALGPNLSPSKSTPMLLPGDRDLSRIARAPTLDACVLEFEFKAPFDSISFDFFFGSEEYPEYVNKGVNDVFAFLLKKEGDDFAVNLARLPDNLGPITVDNVNENKNSQFYLKVPHWDENNVLMWEERRDEGELALTYQFDGLTKVIPAASRITPNHWYYLKIAIADAGDELYDSGVFLKAGSFKAYKSVQFIPQQNFALFKNFDAKQLKTAQNGNIVLITHIAFDFDKWTIKPESHETLKKIMEVLQNDPLLHVSIEGHTDDKGDEDYNLELSEKRAQSVLIYFTENGIDANRLKNKGFGETIPLVGNTTDENRAQNRRVEFVFSKQ